MESLELERVDFNPNNNPGKAAVDIYLEELFFGETPESVQNQIDGLTTYVYILDEEPVAISSIDLSAAIVGAATLKYMAVAVAARNRGIGIEIINQLLHDLNELNGLDNPTLFVEAQPSTIDYYLAHGARQDLNGALYFGGAEEPWRSWDEPDPDLDTDCREGWRKWLDPEDLELGSLIDDLEDY